MRGLLIIKRTKRGSSQRCKIIISQIVTHLHSLGYGVMNFEPLGHGELFHYVEDVQDGGGHARRLARGFCRCKLAGCLWCSSVV